jgi:hypothetical protein
MRHILRPLLALAVLAALATPAAADEELEVPTARC